MSQFSVCTYTSFRRLTQDGLESAEGGCDSPRLRDSDILVSLQSGVCDTLENMSFMAVLRGSVIDMFLGYMAYPRSHDVDWLHCTPSWIPYNLSMREMSDVPSRSASPTHSHMADVKPNCDHTVPFHPLDFVSDYVTASPTIQVLVPQ